ncbi:PREDICTED: vegetative cell wall protein gp1-like [Bison bison bison]|uniref:Vegetative cell wall protein gp1-like n=1 Tax=Bison bison bison TaxID=43346 RepID=A0A6P3G4W8_BISBB|nr:PREDICTED: vegetative cell wall protein gp1-like [Bison bison bison]
MPCGIASTSLTPSVPCIPALHAHAPTSTPPTLYNLTPTPPTPCAPTSTPPRATTPRSATSGLAPPPPVFPHPRSPRPESPSPRSPVCFASNKTSLVTNLVMDLEVGREGGITGGPRPKDFAPPRDREAQPEPRVPLLQGRLSSPHRAP